MKQSGVDEVKGWVISKNVITVVIKAGENGGGDGKRELGLERKMLNWRR